MENIEKRWGEKRKREEILEIDVSKNRGKGKEIILGSLQGRSFIERDEKIEKCVS